MGRTISFVAMLSLLSIGFMRPAYAYLDPGTGSMLLQFLFIGFATAVGVLTHLRQKVAGYFRRKPNSRKD